MVYIDIRVKLILFLICNILVFVRKNLIFGISVFSMIFIISNILGEGKIGIKYLVKYIVLIGFEYIFINSDNIFLGILGSMCIFIRLLFPIILFANLIIKTSRLNDLMTALYYFRFPRSFIITLVMSIRFFPSLRRELKSIYDGMKLRGYRLNIKNIVFRPRQLMNAVLVPTIMRSTIIADEIGIAAVTRGIDNPKERTGFIELSMTGKDKIILFLFILFLGFAFYFSGKRFR
ncbi:MAG: energy-coupling factor transporter transmembrane component T [Tissierellia bacterium]|nr:energy-coupling factor transporter transmembrane component T [Tissierellia bacterium]